MREAVQRLRNAAALLERRIVDTPTSTRSIILFTAALILFVRMPATFVRPEFWAEDSILFSAAYNHGWASLAETLGGTYFNFYGSLIANIAVQFPPLWWPWISAYGAHAAALMVVFLVTSPRFDMPYKTIAALAVVATPIQDSVLAGLANAQWVLPTGIFVLLFCKTPRAPSILAIEAIFIAVAGLDGPLGCFLVPLFAWRAWYVAPPERRRLALLLAILAVTATIQVATIVQHLNVFSLVQPLPYDHIVWITMPLRWIDALRLAGIFGKFSVGAAIVIFGGGALFWWSLRQPYRDQKLSMIFFAGLILYSGMFKYRHFLYLHDNDRYVYVGSVFFFWFLCIWAASARREAKIVVVAVAATLIITSTARRINEPRLTAQIRWADQAPRIGSGPIAIPVAPEDIWVVKLDH